MQVFQKMPKKSFFGREFAMMFAEADKNKNGRIDFDEFVDMMLPSANTITRTQTLEDWEEAKDGSRFRDMNAFSSILNDFYPQCQH